MCILQITFFIFYIFNYSTLINADIELNLSPGIQFCEKTELLELDGTCELDNLLKKMNCIQLLNDISMTKIILNNEFKAFYTLYGKLFFFK